jgi:hypothetical protein
MLDKPGIIGWSEQRDLLAFLGDIQPEDWPQFISMLERDPLDGRALSCPARCSGQGEKVLAEIWRKHVPWWPSLSADV